MIDAPAVLSVGDMHLDNLGTWRDAEGRLVWGINDFDEAAILPYPLDLARLAVSAILANQEKALSILPRDACLAILNGYWEGLEKRWHALRTGREPSRTAQHGAASITQSHPILAQTGHAAFIDGRPWRCNGTFASGYARARIRI